MSVVVTIMCSSASTNADQQTLSHSDHAEVVANLSVLLNDKYVFPEVAEKAITHIQERLNSGAYESAESPKQFAQLLSDDLQSISRDGHLRVRPLDKKRAVLNETDSEVAQIIRRREEKRENYGLVNVEVLEGNVGYLKLNHFSDHASAKQTAFAMMTFLTNVDALIIDLRSNVGGSSDMMRYLLSYFLKENTLVRKTYTRDRTEAAELRTLNYSLAHSMQDVPLYVLTSGQTASAAEAFSSILKQYERGTLVGEKATAGLANPGRVFRLSPSYKVFIPTKHTVGPLSNTNWAGTGVSPDLNTSAETVFERAYEQAKIAAAEYGENKTKRMIADIKASVQTLVSLETEQNEAQLKESVKDVLDELLGKWDLDETAINDMGYRYLQQHNNPTVAKYVFTYNRDSHPTSSNVYSSLADAHAELGEVKLAIKNYKQALAIDPDDGYAEEMLRRLNLKKD